MATSIERLTGKNYQEEFEWWW